MHCKGDCWLQQQGLKVKHQQQVVNQRNRAPRCHPHLHPDPLRQQMKVQQQQQVKV
jgi:hypothetical protein